MPTIELWLGLNCRDGLHLLPVNDGAGAQAGHLHGPNRDDDGAYCDLHDHRDEYRLRQHWPFETAPLSSCLLCPQPRLQPLQSAGMGL